MFPSARLNGSRAARIANNVNVSIEGMEGEELVLRLGAQGISVSARSACSMEVGGASYVIEALGEGQSRALSSVRFTFLPDAKMSDVKRIREGLAAVTKTMHRAL